MHIIINILKMRKLRLQGRDLYKFYIKESDKARSKPRLPNFKARDPRNGTITFLNTLKLIKHNKCN